MLTDGLIVGAVSFIVAMIAVVKPIVALNTNIAKLNATLEALQARTEEKHAQLEHRVDVHGNKIDDLEKTVVKHDVRITNIEKGGCK